MPNKKTDEQEFKRINCKIPWSLWRQGNIQAMDEHIDFQDIVVKALESYLKRGKETR